MHKIIKLLTLVAIINAFGCSKESSLSKLQDEGGDVFTPIKDSDFDPIPAVNVEPYVDAVKDLCVEGCYNADNPKIDFSWSNANLPGKTTVAEILGGSAITIATEESLEYNPAPQEANYKTPGASDSTKPSPDSVGKDIADMQLKARQEEINRRNKEAEAAIKARELTDDLQSRWIENFSEASKTVADFGNESLKSLAANTANSPKITATGSYNDLTSTISQGKTGRDQAQKRIEEVLPKVQIKPNPNVHQYKTDAQAVEGLAVRRADSYLSYAKRTIENPSYPEDGKARARNLLNEASTTLDYADSKYSVGQKAYGDKALEVSYALADMALAVAPYALFIAFPETAIIAVGIEAFNVGKAWYEYKTGRRFWDDAPLSPIQKDMALVNVGLSFVPAGVIGAATVFTTSKTAIAFAKDILAIGKTSDEIAAIAVSVSKAERIVDAAQKAGIVEGEAVSELLEAAGTTAKSPGISLDKAVDDLLATAEKAQPRPPTPGRPERLAGFSDTKERSIAEYLEDLGRVVQKNPNEGVPGVGRQADAIVDGVPVEFKSLEPGASSSTIRNTVRNSVDGGGQARTIQIDTRGTGMSEAEAKRGIFRALGAYGDKLDYLSVIGDGFFVGYGPRPK
ncbi:MAG TPA: hypothetical protein VE954_08515 [Oligoflexus sp.]|uniref:CdiA C-terminal domain-containing protein n=1 Tax=Oligoflexus sp. TaxID=1971216 RepID=UPI002D61361E|nr:hypothetical protein [Oligoflexus sp.]HYX33146.1 hypothetical protein [Oligoflexus sp.]